MARRAPTRKWCCSRMDGFPPNPEWKLGQRSGQLLVQVRPRGQQPEAYEELLANRWPPQAVGARQMRMAEEVPAWLDSLVQFFGRRVGGTRASFCSFPEAHEASSPGRRRAADIANRFQPKLLMYRLRNFRRVRGPAVAPRGEFPEHGDGSQSSRLSSRGSRYF